MSFLVDQNVFLKYMTNRAETISRLNGRKKIVNKFDNQWIMCEFSKK